MQLIYSGSDLTFLTACLDDIQQRLQGLLRSSRRSTDRQETLRSLSRLESAKRALAARKDGEFSPTLNDLRVYYIAALAKRDELNRLLDAPGRPAGLQDDLLACTAACNSILRVIRANVTQAGLDLKQFVDSCTGASLAGLPDGPGDAAPL